VKPPAEIEECPLALEANYLLVLSSALEVSYSPQTFCSTIQRTFTVSDKQSCTRQLMVAIIVVHYVYCGFASTYVHVCIIIIEEN